MRAGAFTDLRVIRLINRRFVPFYFNTGGPGLGHDRAANRFVDRLSTPHEKHANLNVISDPTKKTSNTIAYFAAFSTEGEGQVIGVGSGWRNEKESRDLESLYPGKEEVFQFLVELLDAYPEYNRFTGAETAIIQQAESNPDDPSAQFDAGYLYEELGQYQKALGFYAKAKSLHEAARKSDTDKYPTNAIAEVFKAQMRIARYQKDWESLGKTIKAVKTYGLHKTTDIGADLAAELGYQLLADKDYKAVKNTLESAIEDFPNSTRIGELHYYSGVADFFLQDKPSAYYHWCWIVENTPESHLSRRAYISAAHEDFPYPNFELGGFRTNQSIGTHSIVAAYSKAKRHYVRTLKAKRDRSRNRQPANRDSTQVKKELKPVCVFTGANSQVMEEQFLRVSSQADWEETWHRHHGMSAQKAFEEMIDEFRVDFETHEVVAIFSGSGVNQRSLTVESMAEMEDRIHIQYDVWGYQTHGGSNPSSAFGFIVIPKSPKRITLDENVQGLIGEPPKWRRRAELEAR